MITQLVRKIDSKRLFITHWKVAGELHNPKNITNGIKQPKGVRNAARKRSSGLIRMLLNPHQISSLVKTMAEVSDMISWSMRGSG